MHPGAAPDGQGTDAATFVEVDVLGPLRITTAAGAVDVTGSRERAALAWLVAEADRPVGIAALARVVWERPTSGAAQRLRTLLRAVADRLPPGVLQVGDVVRLAVSGDAIDAGRFARLVREGYRCWSDGDSDGAGTRCDAALSLWRGAPYPELAHCADAAAEVERLHRLYLDARELQQEVRLRGVVDFTTVADLKYLVGSFPVRRRLRVQLARAQYLTGRQVEALRTLRRATAELGDDRDIGDLMTLMLRRDPAVAAVTSIPTVASHE